MRRWMNVLVAAAALLAVAAALGPAARPGTAQAAEDDAARDYIEVSGVGELRVVPDLAVLNLGVYREAQTAARAHSDAASAAQAVVQALRQAGVAERDLQTSGISIQPRYAHEDRSGPRVVGYAAEVSLTVTLRRPDQAGAIIDRAVAAGANQVGGLGLTVADPAAARREALQRAYADARARAEALARAAGVRLLEPIWVVEQDGSGPVIPMRVMKAVAAEQASVPVLPGEVPVQVQVRVRFAVGR